MARPLSTGKKSVNLASPEVRVSKIRRDPPPVVKEKIVLDPDERDQWNVVVGVLAFTLAIFVIILAVSSYTDRSPRQYTVQV
jgi:hypothetical protein